MMGAPRPKRGVGMAARMNWPPWLLQAFAIGSNSNTSLVAEGLSALVGEPPSAYSLPFDAETRAGCDRGAGSWAIPAGPLHAPVACPEAGRLSTSTVFTATREPPGPEKFSPPTA